MLTKGMQLVTDRSILVREIAIFADVYFEMYNGMDEAALDPTT